MVNTYEGRGWGTGGRGKGGRGRAICDYYYSNITINLSYTKIDEAILAAFMGTSEKLVNVDKQGERVGGERRG